VPSLDVVRFVSSGEAAIVTAFFQELIPSSSDFHPARISFQLVFAVKLVKINESEALGVAL
jgi:hypothetical protein